jgi:hypothetical protein
MKSWVQEYSRYEEHEVRLWIVGVYKMQGTSWTAEDLLAS